MLKKLIVFLLALFLCIPLVFSAYADVWIPSPGEYNENLEKSIEIDGECYAINAFLSSHAQAWYEDALIPEAEGPASTLFASAVFCYISAPSHYSFYIEIYEAKSDIEQLIKTANQNLSKEELTLLRTATVEVLYAGDIEESSFSPEDFSLEYYYIDEAIEIEDSSEVTEPDTSQETTEKPTVQNTTEKPTAQEFNESPTPDKDRTDNNTLILIVLGTVALVVAAFVVILLVFKKKS